MSRMVAWDGLEEIVSNLKRHKLRTLLAAFGVFWGMLMLVILLGFGGGFGYKIEADFQDNNNVLIIFPRNVTQMPYMGFGVGRQVSLGKGDVSSIRENISTVDMVNGKNTLGGWGSQQPVSQGKFTASFAVSGSHQGWLPYEFPSITRMIDGRYFNLLDERERRKVAVIGMRVKEILFENEKDVIGKVIRINGVNFNVIGVYRNFDSEGSGTHNSSIFVPNDTFATVFNKIDKFDLLMFTPKQGFSSAEVELAVKKHLYERHKVHPSDGGVFQTWNHQEFYLQQQKMVLGIKGFSWIVAVGTIIAGVVGVGNVMLIIVKERSSEIGLRKTLGATPVDIGLMIMCESLLITFISGYIGLIVGVIFLEIIKVVLIEAGKGDGIFSTPFVDIDTAGIALLSLVVSSVVAALVPAMRAALVNPVAALQDE